MVGCSSAPVHMHFHRQHLELSAAKNNDVLGQRLGVRVDLDLALAC